MLKRDFYMKFKHLATITDFCQAKPQNKINPKYFWTTHVACAFSSLHIASLKYVARRFF